MKAKRFRYRYVTITIPHNDGAPIQRKSVLINARWCAYRADEFSGWSLTHRATGYSAGKGLRTVEHVRALARALERAYPAKRWTFTDPKAARGLIKAIGIIRLHEAFL